MPKAAVNGTELYYEVHGEGPVITFAHGVGGNHASWVFQVPYFSRWYKVITFDHRGFGNSAEAPDAPGRSKFIDDLRGLLDHAGVEKTALVAQSMGGWTCLGFTQAYPDRVSALALCDTAAGITWPGPYDDLMEEVRKRTDSLGQLERVLSNDLPKRNPQLAHLYSEIASFNYYDRKNLKGQTPPVTAEQLGKMKTPALFLVGAQDVLYPPEAAQTIYKLVPGASLEIVQDSGHSVYFEQPAVFNHVIHGFLMRAGIGPKAL